MNMNFGAEIGRLGFHLYQLHLLRLQQGQRPPPAPAKPTLTLVADRREPEVLDL